MTALKPIYLKDYAAPAYTIHDVALHFDINESAVDVRTTLSVAVGKALGAPLILDGEALTLKSVALNGQKLASTAYQVNEQTLTIHQVPQQDFTLIIETEIKPQDNTTLMGLYKSGNIYCTQCEAMGFRRMTYYIDRPDVMASFTTTIAADKAKYPVLLSNGNLIQRADLAEGRHSVTWQDPFKKPAYLFALVAGDLALVEDYFTTRSGRRITLQIYVEKGNESKCQHAMRSLQKAMRWDEETFGLEYDLDIYMIVAVHDFNQGAMENKGLNIFNDKYILAQPETATDTDYQLIEGVIGHEYFHNWTGNRVTLRDWFQLSLKEGLTVFRDAQFSADMNSHAVKRIEDANMLRSQQFIEDKGPMAHPVRPESYIEMNNFYTLTVYEKGAEIIRMMQTMLGKDKFRKGMDLYFKRHDGQAVTTDDFVNAMQAASGIDLTQFKLWYSIAGTPKVTLRGQYDNTAKKYNLSLTQHINPTPDQTHKPALHIPFAVGLLNPQGKEVANQLLHLREISQTFTFNDIKEPPVVSVLRDFSAPVEYAITRSTDELMFLLAHDNDSFARWDAGQQLLKITLLDFIKAGQARKVAPLLDPKIVTAFKLILTDKQLDPALIAEFLQIPSEKYMGEWLDTIDVEAVHWARNAFRLALGNALKNELWQVYEINQASGPYSIDAIQMAKRSLKNRCLGYLMAADAAQASKQVLQQFNSADNMTDVLAALTLTANFDSNARPQALQTFYNKWQHEPLVVEKWLSIQAMSEMAGTTQIVAALTTHPAFDIKNPNKVYSLLRSFGAQNMFHFHEKSGLGYCLIADHVLLLDDINPMVAARLASTLLPWKRYDAKRQQLMAHELNRIAGKTSLSRDVYEIVSKALDH